MCLLVWTQLVTLTLTDGRYEMKVAAKYSTEVIAIHVIIHFGEEIDKDIDVTGKNLILSNVCEVTNHVYAHLTRSSNHVIHYLCLSVCIYMYKSMNTYLLDLTFLDLSSSSPNRPLNSAITSR